MSISIDLFKDYLYTVFAQAKCRTWHADSQVCVCLFLLHSEADCSGQIKVCRHFWVLPLRQASSADSPDGCVSPALGDINTQLMSPFLEESGNNQTGQNVHAESVPHPTPFGPQVPYGFLGMHKQKDERSSDHINHGLREHWQSLQAHKDERITWEEDVREGNELAEKWTEAPTL